MIQRRKSSRRSGMGKAPSASLLLALSWLAAACAGGTETGNPSFDAELSYGAYSSAPDVVAVRDTGDAVSVSAAWLVLGDADFVEAEGCSTAAPVIHAAPGLGVGNHAGLVPARTEFELVPADYCGVSLPFLPATAETLPSEAPAGLVGHSILIEGTLGSGRAFTLQSSAALVVELSPESGAFAMSDAEANALMGFDVAIWLGELDWASLPGVTEPIEVSAESNPALLAAFESRLAEGVALFRDSDGDGRMDPAPVRLAQGR